MRVGRVVAWRTTAMVVAMATTSAAAGCSDEPASLRVIVREGTRLPQRLDALRLDQWAVGAGDDDDDGQDVARLVRSIGAAALYSSDGELAPWSVLLSRASGDGPTQRYRVRAAGIRDDDDYVRVEARVSIAPGEATLTLSFESACVLRRCATGQSCADGRCIHEREVGCAAVEGTRFPWCADPSGRDGGTLDATASDGRASDGATRDDGAPTSPDGARPDAEPVRCVGATGDCDGDPVNGCETDLTTTAAHCSACRAACPVGERCEGGLCVCGTRAPSGRGELGFSCADDASGTGRHCCNGECVDVRSDATRCGACDVACGGGETCTDGRCTCGTTTRAGAAACGSGESCCGGFGAGSGMACADVTSASSCGSCGASCPANETCSSGSCSCAGGPTCSGGTCTGESCVTSSGQ